MGGAGDVENAFIGGSGKVARVPSVRGGSEGYAGRATRSLGVLTFVVLDVDECQWRRGKQFCI